MASARLIFISLALFLHCSCGNASTGSSKKVPTILNRKLVEAHRLKIAVETTLQRCADRCVYETNCLSVSYRLHKGVCEFYRINSTQANETDIYPEDNVILVDISHWLKDRTDVCWNKPCPADTICVPNLNTYFCIHKNNTPIGCPPYSLPENGIQINDVGNGLVPFGIQIHLRCKEPFVTDIANPVAHYILTCRGRSSFDWQYRCYTVEELCVHHFLEKFYNLVINNTVSSTTNTWDPADILLNATRAWKAAGHNNQQYILVQFNQPYWIGGVATQGGPGGWVTVYRVKYSVDCITYKYIKEANGEIKQFSSNVDENSVVKNIFEKPVSAACIRIEALQFHVYVTMRIDFLACHNLDEGH